MSKYDSKGPFNDPVIRCCECQNLIMRTIIHKDGQCPNCGCKRIRNVLAMNDKEMDRLKELGVDPEFLALFEGVE